jgi:hypothetical protein
LVIETETTNMTHFITALTNDKAQLIVSETQTTDVQLCTIIVHNLKTRGYIVRVKTES